MQQLKRPPISAQLTPPSATFSSPCANSLHSSARVVWPSIYGALDTPERKRAAVLANSCSDSSVDHNNPAQTDMFDMATNRNLTINEDSGLGDSFLELPARSIEVSYFRNTK